MPRKLPDLLLSLAFILVISFSLFSPLPDLSQFWDQDCPAGSHSIACRLKAWVKFPAAFNAYFSDHYLLHKEQVSALESVRFHLLDEKTYPNVLIGNNDWLYYTGENNLQDYECSMPFTNAELETIRTRLLDWQSQLQERGIRFYVVIAPNKESIYPQYLPGQVRAGLRACRIDQVLDVLGDTSLNVLDLRDALQSAAQTAQVYHRTDTHWNSLGAFIASREIISLASRDFPDLSIPSLNDYAPELQSHSGDLAGFLPRDDRFIEQETVLTPLAPAKANFVEGTDLTAISTIPGSSLPSALVFCDSFSDALKPYLSEHFSRVVYSRSFSLDLGLVDQEKPDVVVFEIAQRYLTVLR